MIFENVETALNPIKKFTNFWDEIVYFDSEWLSLF